MRLIVIFTTASAAIAIPLPWPGLNPPDQNSYDCVNAVEPGGQSGIARRPDPGALFESFDPAQAFYTGCKCIL